jgi:hypothetical protein
MPPKCCTDASKYVPTVPAQNSAINVVRLPWEACQNFQKTTQRLLEICAKITVVRIVRNPYSTNCTFCLGFHAFFFLLYGIRKSVQYGLFCWTVLSLDFCAYSSCCTTCSICTVRPAFNVVLAASIFVLVCSLGMCALALQKWLPLQTRKCSLSCSLNNESTTQQWVRPPTLIDLMK